MIPMTINDSRLSVLIKNSAYASRWLSAQPQWVEGLVEGVNTPINPLVIEKILDPVYQVLSQETPNLDVLGAQLRLSRQKLMLLLALRDLSGLADVSEVTEAMSCFAEKSIAIGLSALRKDMYPMVGEPQSKNGQYLPLIVVGMGKLGGKELNVSSDIDLVFLYEEEGDTRGGVKSISHHEWYSRLGKKLLT